MKIWLAFAAMFKKEFIITIRYFFNSVGGIITIYLVFLLIFLGYRGIAGGAAFYGEGLGSLVVGFVMWTMLLMAYQVIPYTVLSESQEGTLEQLYMSPRGFVMLGTFRLVSEAILNMFIVILMLVLLMATTGQWLNIDLVSLFPLVLVSIATAAGLSFFFGGLSLLFKRIQSYLQIVQFALVGLVAAPPSISFFRFLPISLPSHWVRQIMVRGDSLADIPLNDWLLMAATTAAYLAIGILFFLWCEQRARRQGILGHF